LKKSSTYSQTWLGLNPQIGRPLSRIVGAIGLFFYLYCRTYFFNILSSNFQKGQGLIKNITNEGIRWVIQYHKPALAKTVCRCEKHCLSYWAKLGTASWASVSGEDWVVGQPVMVSIVPTIKWWTISIGNKLLEGWIYSDFNMLWHRAFILFLCLLVQFYYYWTMDTSIHINN
jgi:hypothetical protein